MRVFVSSTLAELADEREAVRSAIAALRLTPVMFEAGARAHPPRELYRAYLEQSDVFVGIYARRYGWVAPGERVSGLEDEYLRSGHLPRLIYVKRVDGARDDGLERLLARVRDDDRVSYRPFRSADELRELVADDLAALLSERFEAAPSVPEACGPAPVPGVLGPLFGRDAELDLATRLLDDPLVRVLTIVGPGGIGKSRLALELSHRRCASTGDGVAFVGLQGVHDHRLVARTIAAAFGLDADDERDAVARLEAYLAPRRTLLVVDNVEQVADAALLLARLVEVAPQLSVLATSRAPLHVAAERRLPLGPLALVDAAVLAAAGDGHAGQDAASATDALVAAARANPAVALLAWRLRAVDPTFEVDARSAAPLVRITHRLEGWPLALLLAGARFGPLSLAQLERRLDASLGAPLDALGTGDRDLPERHRTLRRTIAWSLDLLSPPALDLLLRSSVFAHAVDLSGLAAVADAHEHEVLDALGELVDHALVQRVDGVGDDEGDRYVSFELVREAARERLRDAGGLDDATARHVRHLLAVAERDGVALQRGHADRLHALRGSADDFRLAQQRALASDDVTSLARFARALWLFWWIESLGAETLRWLAPASERLDVDAPTRIGLLLGRCACALQMRDLEQATSALGAATALLAEHRDDEAGVVLGIARAILAAERGDAAACAAEAAVVRAGAEGLRWTWAETFASVLLARAALGRGDVAGALAWAERAAERQAASGDRQSEVWARSCMVVAQLLAGDAAAAWTPLRVALRNLERLGFRAASAFGLELAALVAAGSGASEHAERLAGAAVAASRTFGRACFEPEASIVAGALAAAVVPSGAAWREGLGMPLDVALRYALDLPVDAASGNVTAPAAETVGGRTSEA